MVEPLMQTLLLSLVMPRSVLTLERCIRAFRPISLFRAPALHYTKPANSSRFPYNPPGLPTLFGLSPKGHALQSTGTIANIVLTPSAPGRLSLLHLGRTQSQATSPRQPVPGNPSPSPVSPPRNLVSAG
jgi:hypothetical protein